MSQLTHLGRVLIVDDEVELMRALCDSLSDEGFKVKGSSDPHSALDELRRNEYDLILTDLMMPGMDGIQLLREALNIEPELIGIIMTGHGTVQTAVEAMKIGAFDYILKPFKLHSILPTLQRAMEVRRLKVENVRLKAHIEHLNFESARLRMVGHSEPMRKVLQMIEKVAGTDATVLIRGPSGSGKELVARALHHNGPRRDKPIVTVNCAALQETLLESELFGHERGAFTGAGQSKPGLFEVADGGTLFIDEIAEMSAGMQAKLLRVLEDGTFRRVGGTEERKANVRVIAATNKPLEEEQKAGRFREDLFYRLNVITIQLPPLRDRKEDIPDLVDHFLTTRRIGRVKLRVDPAAMSALMAYHWPGNIRELANVIERAQILAEGDTITLDDLPDIIADAGHHGLTKGIHTTSEPATQTTAGASPNSAPAQPLSAASTEQAEPTTLREVERRHVARILELHHGNKVHAARALGISRRALYRLIEKHKLEVPHR
jgi:DNA-binding NtrC family response regulator